MSFKDYEYDYHDLVEDAYYIEITDSDEYYYDSGDDEPWMDEDEGVDWENYYHNLTDEIDE
jgi:hypothetical protein